MSFIGGVMVSLLVSRASIGSNQRVGENNIFKMPRKIGNMNKRKKRRETMKIRYKRP
jgi:hypothetical protein